MRKAQGYAQIVGPLGHKGRPVEPQGLRDWGEADTFTCGHCNRIVHVPPRTDPANIGGLCKQCMSLVCSKCVATGRCDPLEKKIERMEAKAHAIRSYGLSN